MEEVTQAYLVGISEGRTLLTSMGGKASREDILGILENLRLTLAQGFSGDIRDSLRGERDFWKNQLELAKSAA